MNLLLPDGRCAHIAGADCECPDKSITCQECGGFSDGLPLCPDCDGNGESIACPCIDCNAAEATDDYNERCAACLAKHEANYEPDMDPYPERIYPEAEMN